MKSFKTYLEESQQQYNYRIKMVVKPDEEKMESIERLLRRYDLIAIDTPVKVENKNSLEFRDIENVDEYYIDVSIGMPMSAYILQQELRSVLNIPEKFVVVRSDNEPIEVESGKRQMLRDLNKIAKEKGLTQKGSLLSTDRFYLDAEQPVIKDAFGDKYNKTFLNFLADVAANRKGQEYEAQSTHIKVSDMKKVKQEPTQDVADFNADYDTPKPVYKVKGKAKYPVDPNYLTSSGNFDDDSKTYFKINRNKNGKIVTNKMSADQIRTPRNQEKQ